MAWCTPSAEATDAEGAVASDTQDTGDSVAVDAPRVEINTPSPERVASLCKAAASMSSL